LDSPHQPGYLMSKPLPRLVGYGYAVPSHIRLNDDPIFDWLHEHKQPGTNLFEGYHERRILADHEDLMTIMVPAAQQALTQAGLVASDVDILIGTGSVSPYQNPDALSELHQVLGLPARTWVIPVGGEFSNFNNALCFADALIRAKRAKNILVCVGSNWSRNVDYHTPQAISAADGAGAAVVALSSDTRKWTLRDQCTITDSSYYGSMVTKPDPFDIAPHRGQVSRLWTLPYFQINAKGIEGFKTFGVQQTPLTATELLRRHNLTGADSTLISHQASSVLMDMWKKTIQPAQYVSSLAVLANMTVANIPVTLAWADNNQPICKDNLILLSIGTDMHANALLLQRGDT
jgi:3-oxoacyl-[acyl-carrier-protein] synthase III